LIWAKAYFWFLLFSLGLWLYWWLLHDALLLLYYPFSGSTFIWSLFITLIILMSSILTRIPWASLLRLICHHRRYRYCCHVLVHSSESCHHYGVGGYYFAPLLWWRCFLVYIPMSYRFPLVGYRFLLAGYRILLVSCSGGLVFFWWSIVMMFPSLSVNTIPLYLLHAAANWFSEVFELPIGNYMFYCKASCICDYFLVGEYIYPALWYCCFVIQCPSVGKWTPSYSSSSLICVLSLSSSLSTVVSSSLSSSFSLCFSSSIAFVITCRLPRALPVL